MEALMIWCLIPRLFRLSRKAPTLLQWALVILVFIASTGCRGEGDYESERVQLATPTGNEDVKAKSAAEYATACGLGATPDLRLPDLGTKATPIRGTNDVTEVGKTTSNDWTLIQHFDKDTKCLASAANAFANLWHKNQGGRDWYYLYRYTDPDPTQKQVTLNGVLGFDDTSICAFDHVYQAAALPPGDLSNLFYAGELEADPRMDDCSDCHVSGYNAPRPKTLGVAKGNKGNKFPWLKVEWLPKWNKYAAAYGPVWKVGKAVKAGTWISGAGTALVDPPKECATCHKKWIPTRNRDTGFYCDSVFATAFDGDGSMAKAGNDFADNATCKAFIDAIGCGPGRPAAGADLTAAICPAPPAALRPMVNDTRLRIQDIQVVSATVVNIVPAHNSSVFWDLSAVFAYGDPWVETIQVWGGPYPGSTTTPMTPVIPVANSDSLPLLQIAGLVPGRTYQFQLRFTDHDTALAFSPLRIVTMPESPGSDGGPYPWPDGGVDAGSGSDGGPYPWPDGGVDAGSGSDGGPYPWPDGGGDAGSGSDGGPYPWPDGSVDAGSGSDGGPYPWPDGGVDAGSGSDGGPYPWPWPWGRWMTRPPV
jgi:hypothetical protein